LIYNKLIDSWQCGECGERFRNPSYRYLLNMMIQDNSKQIWVKAFDEVGEIIFGNLHFQLHLII